MSHDDELAPDARIYRYEHRADDPEFVGGDEALIEELSHHLEAHVGPVKSVFHELVSTHVHVDVHHIEPGPDRPFHVLVTSGMSARPMTTPEQLPDDYRWAELLVCLPADWPISDKAFEDERHYWPVRWLKQLARFPHEYGSWLGYMHTVPNGDPPEPFAPETSLCGMMLVLPLSLPESLHQLERADGTVVRFWSLLPLYAEEMELKLKKGADVLLELLDEAGVSDVIDPHRPNVAAKKRWWPF